LICEVAIGPVSNSLLKDGSSQSDYKTLLILDSVVSSINIVIFKIKGLANVVNNPSSPAFGDVIIRFGSSTDVQWSTTRSCVSLVVTPLTTSNALVPQSMIQCTLPSGVEQSLAFSVWIYDISLVPVLAPYGSYPHLVINLIIPHHPFYHQHYVSMVVHHSLVTSPHQVLTNQKCWHFLAPTFLSGQ
jgi:hypothetical protein